MGRRGGGGGGGGVTDFVSEIRYLKGHPNFETSVVLTRYGSNICMSKILQMNL